ncbi:hypothetical protein [Sinomicrobium weinanense]|uniref:Tetratricopeptide repeat protein n=1 Tax=Sinomicrobium weinanense TaxID=2842200 RepID=A0A926JRG1_9FLAO|nr:hypothetical protein [Sinomicrobium weinanense]MBC9796140.1 hypothetical protein [Sinomicrobium weinanense]MBU3121891.1 hypothetical protein [Sinomicrobium weinanense]
MKYFLLFVILLLNYSGFATPDGPRKEHPVSFCAGGFEADYQYYNLFAQENIEEPRYKAFLLTYNNRYYTTNKEENTEKNENIEDWQKYLSITYEQARYLVFRSDRDELRALAGGKAVSDKKLDFIDAHFIKKHKQALLYLAYAKYLEPYMTVKGGRSNYWRNTPEHTVEELDYDKVINVLERSWQAETDKDLKLRYGYQLVRFAHYNLKHSEAINYFNSYVESLAHKPIMYYYALDQKGGAERALGHYMQAHYDFFRFFTHTKNRKARAYTSMRVTQDLDFEKLLAGAETTAEKNDLYMLLGYRDFNNPLSSFNKIIQNDPNAPQAKVLMARAVNQLERDYFPIHYSCPYNNQDCMKELNDRRIPLDLNRESGSFLQQSLNAALRQANNNAVKEQGFWQLTTAWLYYIQGDYKTARDYLGKMESGDSRITRQKDRLAMLIDISEQPEITPDFEELLVKDYGSIFNIDSIAAAGYSYPPGVPGFLTDVLANRYFLQKDYAKAFLLQNHITALEYRPDMELLEAIGALYHKKDKMPLNKCSSATFPRGNTATRKNSISPEPASM